MRLNGGEVRGEAGGGGGRMQMLLLVHDGRQHHVCTEKNTQTQRRDVSQTLPISAPRQGSVGMARCCAAIPKKQKLTSLMRLSRALVLGGTPHRVRDA